MKKKTAATNVIAGRNPVREALERGDQRLEKVLLQRDGGRVLQGMRGLAKAAGVPVQFVPKNKLEQLAPGVNHQGVVAMMAPVAYRDADELLAEIAPTYDEVQRQKPMLLVLDRIEDPYNFGAMLRSAVAAGVDGVFVPTKKMAPLNAAAIKTSAGTALQIPIARVPQSLDVFLQQLKERGYWAAGAAGDGDETIWTFDWDRPVAIVIGSEDRGLHPAVAAACDARVSIPMRGPAESLNASVATGLFLFAAARVRPAG